MKIVAASEACVHVPRKNWTLSYPQNLGISTNTFMYICIKLHVKHLHALQLLLRTKMLFQISCMKIFSYFLHFRVEGRINIWCLFMAQIHAWGQMNNQSLCLTCRLFVTWCSAWERGKEKVCTDFKCGGVLSQKACGTSGLEGMLLLKQNMLSLELNFFVYRMYVHVHFQNVTAIIYALRSIYMFIRSL